MGGVGGTTKGMTVGAMGTTPKPMRSTPQAPLVPRGGPCPQRHPPLHPPALPAHRVPLPPQMRISQPQWRRVWRKRGQGGKERVRRKGGAGTRSSKTCGDGSWWRWTESGAGADRRSLGGEEDAADGRGFLKVFFRYFKISLGVAMTGSAAAGVAKAGCCCCRGWCCLSVPPPLPQAV